MKKIQKVAFFMMFLMVAVGFFIFMNRPPAPATTVGHGTPVSWPAADLNKKIIPVKKDSAADSGPAGDEDGGGVPAKKIAARKSIAVSKPVVLVLNAEKSLVTEIEGDQGMDVRAGTSLMVGDGFDDLMEHLSIESLGIPLARDVTDLYARAAEEASRGGDDSINMNITCGMVVCGVSATAATQDAFEAWFRAFVENQSAPPNALGRYDKILDNGSVEHRMIFSTDPQKNQVVARPR